MTDILKEFGFNTSESSDDIETGNMPTILKWVCTNNPGWSTYEGKDDNEVAIYKPVTMPEKVVVDMPNFKRGFRKWEGKQKTDVLASNGQELPDKPAKDWQPVVVFNLYSKHLDFCEFGTTTVSVIRSLASLYNDYMSRTESAPHLVPVCQTGVESYTAQKGGEIFYPTFKIIKYVARPVQLISAAESPEPAAKPTAKPKAEVTEPEFDDSLDVLDADDEF